MHRSGGSHQRAAVALYTCPGAVDTTSFKPGYEVGTLGATPRPLYHGRVDRRKGVLDFIEALGPLRDWSVIVATVFTASVSAPRGFALACQLDKGLAADLDYMALRRDEIVAPQAIGAHVGHVAVYMAMRSFRRPLRLWADFLYAIRSGARKSPFEDGALVEEKIELGPDECKDKTAATAAYASQLRFQFGGITQADDAMSALGRTEIFKRTR